MRRSEVVTARRPRVRMIFLKTANSRSSLAATRTSEKKILSLGFTETFNGRRWTGSWPAALPSARRTRLPRYALWVYDGKAAILLGIYAVDAGNTIGSNARCRCT